MVLPVAIQGAKGPKSSSGSTPTNTPDNLRSKDTIEVILGLGEGPWYGLPRGQKDFLVNSTQLENDDGTVNFQSFVFNFFPGNPSGEVITPVLGGISNNTAVSVDLETGTTTTRTGTTNNIDYIDHRLQVNRLLSSTDKGTFNASVTYRIEYKAQSASEWIKVFGQDITISGKTTSTYIKETRIAVPRINEPYMIRTTKITGDDTTTFYADITWESFQETIAGPMSFPNTVCVQVVAEANDQFSGIPTWSGVYRGLIVKVPTNYDPIARTYTGMWDGTWQLAWTNNPAWCLYDFIMNDRYGIKQYYPQINMDKYDIYAAAQWCDETVPDGEGGLQPRFTYNDYVTEARSGLEMARYIAGVFNATFFDDRNGTAYLIVDKDDVANHIFTKENVYDTGFSYSYTDISTRYNNITVTFDNPELEWNTDRRRVFDQSLIDKNGNIPLDYVAVGCTNAHEAIRRTQNKLISSNTETCIVNFQTNRQGQFVKPFDVMLIVDPDMGYGMSGRILTLSTDRKTISLRTPVYLEAGVPYTIRVVLDDGTSAVSTLTRSKAGYNTQLVMVDALPDNLPTNATWTLEYDGKIGLPRPFRVTQVEETDGTPDMFTIQGVNINRNKWYDSDNVTESGVVQYSSLPSPLNPPGPTTCTFTETFLSGTLQFELIVNPTFDRGAYKYYTNDHSFEVWSRPSGTSEAFTKRDVVQGDVIFDHPPGPYDFKILGKSYLGKTTALDSAPIFEFTVTNPKDKPATPDWLKVNDTEYYWGYISPPLDFAGFELRYQNVEERTTWDDAIQPHDGLLSVTSFTSKLVPASARVIMVKAVDAFGNESENPAIIYRPLGDVLTSNVVDTITFDLSAGTMTGCSYTTGKVLADDTGELMYTGTPTAHMFSGGDGSSDFYKATYYEMYYQQQFSVETAGTGIINIAFQGAGYELSIREVSSPPGPWNPVPVTLPLALGDYELRVRIFGGPVRGEIDSLSIDIDLDTIDEELQDLTVSGTGLLRLPITKTYSAIKVVSVTIQNDGSSTAVTYRVIDKQTTIGAGPQIETLDASGTRVAALIDATIKGY